MDFNENQMKQFAKEISKKLYPKLQSAGSLYPSSICDMVCQMIEHKMKKERWIKEADDAELKAALEPFAKDGCACGDEIRFEGDCRYCKARAAIRSASEGGKG